MNARLFFIGRVVLEQVAICIDVDEHHDETSILYILGEHVVQLVTPPVVGVKITLDRVGRFCEVAV